MIAKDAGMPSLRTESAASAGPTARARLYVIELSATADCSCDRGTRSAISACDAGAENALTTPSPSEKTHHDPDRREPRPGEHGEHAAERGRDELRHEHELAAVEAVGRAARPRREHEDGDERRELEHAEQERRVRVPVDEERRGEILEPRPARRRRVADEVRARSCGARSAAAQRSVRPQAAPPPPRC